MSGTCVFLNCLVLDFGENVLPLLPGYGYISRRHRRPVSGSKCWDVLYGLPELLHDVRGTGQPGWRTGVSDPQLHGPWDETWQVASLILPAPGRMAEVWSRDVKRFSRPFAEVLTVGSLSRTAVSWKPNHEFR